MPGNSLTSEDKDRIIRRLGTNLLGVATHFKLALAGGAVRAIIAGERVRDFDFFGHDKAVVEAAANDYAVKAHAEKVTTPNAITVMSQPAAQFVTRWTFRAPGDVIEHFDFTIARAVIAFGPEATTRCDVRFYPDLAARRLRYTSPGGAEPGASLLRAVKFIQRGYRMPVVDWADLLAALYGDARVSRRSGDELAAAIRGLMVPVDPNRGEAEAPEGEDRG